MISRTSRYALRTLSVLVGHGDKGPLLRRDLAELVGAPSQYLAKILVTLSKAGILQAARGTGGGYQLQVPADEISMFKVVELFDGKELVGACLFDDKHLCSDFEGQMHPTPWCNIHKTYLDFLNKTSIAELATCSQLPGSHR